MINYCRYLAVLLLVCFSTAHAQQVIWNPEARWINAGRETDFLLRPCPVFKKEITVTRKIQSAYALITAHGVYEAAVNGRRVGNAYFTPGWTDYDTRLQYQRYAIEDLLHQGVNDIQVVIGEGWYRGVFGGLMERNIYGRDASLLFQLEIRYADGTTEQVVTDSSWLCTTGPVRHSDIYGGEIYDARLQPQQWQGVTVADYNKNNLVPTINEPVEKHETFSPVRVWTTPAGEQLIDFGQNLSGWVQARVTGRPGDTIRVYHAEVLDKAGNFYTGNLREAAATDTYILKGTGEDTLEPHFTWHGFRYAKVTGCTANPAKWKAVALYSALPQTGSFACSDTLLNQLQHNIEWSMKSNFLDIPTDCPQRSERLGWTGDAHVFFRAAAFNSNVKLFFAKWLQDLLAEQRTDGSVPNIIPNLYKRQPMVSKAGRAGWGDAAAIIPWAHYLVYGDTAILQNQYAGMKAWVDYISSVSKNNLWTANGYGDWLAPGDSTSLPYIDQCFWAWSTQQVIQAATVLGKQEDSAYYTRRLDTIKTAFLQKYIAADGTAITPTQTAYVLALHFNMLPDTLQAAVAARLVALIRARGNHLSTGVLGTPYLLFALSDHGYTEVAYDLLQQRTYPSWLYPVTMGATTIWERWDGIRPDSTVQPTSYNHYAYGAVGDWLYRKAAGIDAAAPGYKKISIQPHAGGSLTWVKASYECPYGKIVSAWQRKGAVLHMQVAIPAGTTATIYIPGKGSKEVGPGKYRFKGVLNR